MIGNILFSDHHFKNLERDYDLSNRAAYAEGTQKNLVVVRKSYLFFVCILIYLVYQPVLRICNYLLNFYVGHSNLLIP